MGRLLTIGYSGLSPDEFNGFLKKHSVDVVCDVRSTPYSHYRPEFSRRPLKESLNSSGIKYKFFGDLLGARPKDRSCYVNGQATYNRISQSTFFHEGIDRVENGLRFMNLALVCSEKDPIECHRAVLVCRYLPIRKDNIIHIHTDGRLETHSSLEDRLMGLYGLLPPPLLRQDIDLHAVLEQAYEKQGDSIAFREKPGSSGK